MNRERLIYIQPCVKRVVMVPELATAGQGTQTSWQIDDNDSTPIVEGDLPEGQEIDVKKNNLWDEEW